jgi:hypothetical protein
MYLRYLDSTFDLRYPDLVAERRALLNVKLTFIRSSLFGLRIITKNCSLFIHYRSEKAAN